MARGASINGSIAVKCSSEWTDFWSNRNVAVCLSIGTGSASASWEPRQMALNGTRGAASLNFQILNSDNVFFGSAYKPRPVVISSLQVPGRGGTSQTVTIPMRGLISSTQMPATMAPGTYRSSFGGSNTLLAVSSPTIGTPADCSTTTNVDATFPFEVSAEVPNFCAISTVSDMQFADVAGIGDTSRNAVANIAVQCTYTTPYKINLTPSNASTNGQGRMALQSGGTDSVPYSLFQNAARTVAWGNQSSSNYSGTGSGLVQNVPVYGLVPANLDATPGNYRDSVQVTVTY
ncbi:Csu type fimbrial protein [Diaphorobacter aerolatus]|uniref:Spore coat U domain-containing protein n=1 Tax=Diaphorobacter aerolatus TaxID=1288495 RepID=A0A7H0GP48_9BURK|nr:spore coat U domain-containing protein [Diaphorobacter aerolatus]QNP50064.1 spore coat U domain-containing protein [Diaphorobacter aerolatus]